MVSVIWETDKENFSQVFQSYLDKIQEIEKDKTIAIASGEKWDVIITVYNIDSAQDIFNQFEKMAQDEFGVENYSVTTSRDEFNIRL